MIRLGLLALLLPARALAVVGGEPGGPPAVLPLWAEGGFACTATLIEPDRALTAGHCVDHLISDDPGLTVGAAAVPVARLWLAPDHWTDPGADLAVLELAAPLDVAPLPWSADGPPEDWELWPLQAAGWGEGVGTEGGVERRTVLGRLEELTETSLWFDGADGALCRGDSGGALLDGGVLVGVVVGGDPDCGGPGEAVRLDLLRDFIEDPEVAADEEAGLALPPDGGRAGPDGCEGPPPLAFLPLLGFGRLRRPRG